MIEKPSLRDSASVLRDRAHFLMAQPYTNRYILTRRLGRVLASIPARKKLRAGLSFRLPKMALRIIINVAEQVCDKKQFLSQLADGPSTSASDEPVLSR